MPHTGLCGPLSGLGVDPFDLLPVSPGRGAPGNQSPAPMQRAIRHDLSRRFLAGRDPWNDLTHEPGVKLLAGNEDVTDGVPRVLDVPSLQPDGLRRGAPVTGELLNFGG